MDHAVWKQDWRKCSRKGPQQAKQTPPPPKICPISVNILDKFIIKQLINQAFNYGILKGVMEIADK